MKRFTKTIVALVLVFSMLLSTVVALAETQWNAGSMVIPVTQGADGYTFMSVYKSPTAAYEMSNHMVFNGVDKNNDGSYKREIPQTLVLVDASTSYDWTPSGPYSFQQSNYEVLYCCDAMTGYKSGVHYKRMNLEDSTYYSAEAAAHIRGIVMSSYPYVSLEQMKSNLAAGGFQGAEEITRADAITAVQSAIWAYANGASGNYYYSGTFHIPTSTRWGGVMNDYTGEMGNIWWNTGAHKVTDKVSAASDEATLAEVVKVEARVNALIDYLKGVTPVAAANNQVVITDLQIVDFIPVQMKQDVYTASLQVKLNNSGSGELDDINLEVYVDDVLYSTQKVVFGQTVYDLKVEAKAEQEIKVVVSGAQILPLGVYFYEAKGGRDVSQSLVGVAGGPTEVYSEAKAKIPGKDPAKANIYLYKTDEDGNALTGAKFALFAVGENTELYVDTYAVDANGMLAIENLVTGSYKITETEAPEGFIPLNGAISFTITETGEVVIDTLPDGVTNEAADNGMAFTCVNRAKYIKISGVKHWNDGDNRDNKRPESITINLLADGVEVAEKIVNAGEDGSWSWEFENLLKYRQDGSEIVYTITEDAVDGYTTEVEGYNVINTYNPETTEITIEKIWDDANDKDGIRPESITVTLYANGEIYETVELNAENGWSVTFTGLYVYENGEKIVYTVDETAVEGYTTAIDGYTITNTHIPNPPKPTTVVFNGIKYLDGMPDAGFLFMLTDANGRVVDYAFSGSLGRFSFDAITFTEVGTYRYRITEVDSNSNGIIYDSSVYEIVVTVTEVGNELIANVTVFRNGANYRGNIAFYNTTEGTTPPQSSESSYTEISDEEVPLDDGLTEILDEEVPLTGDDLNVLYVPILIGALTALAVTAYFLFKKKAE